MELGFGVQIFLIVFQALAAIVTAYIGIRVRRHDSEKEQQKKEKEIEEKALKHGLQAVLRDRILQACALYQRKGCITVSQMDNLSNMYNAYHNLGGNGVVTNVYLQVMDLEKDVESNDVV